MGFFEYFIRYTLVRSLNRILKPKTLLVIVIVLLILFFCFKLEANAVYHGNTTYTDPNNDLFLAYNGIANDLLAKMTAYYNNNQYQNFINYLNNKDYGYYIYYGDFDGSSMLNGITYKQDIIRVAFYDLSDPDLQSTVLFDTYNGLQCNIRGNHALVAVFTFDSILFFDDSVAGDTVYMPTVLYNYRPDVLLQFLDNSSQEQTNQIIDALNQQTNTIQEQTNTIQQQTDYIQATPSQNDFSDSDLPTNSDVGTDTTLDGINNIFTMFYNAMTREPQSSDNILITIPYANKSFYIPYNYTRSFVPNWLKNIINTFWFFSVSVYIVKDIASKFNKLKTGNIEDLQNTNIKGDLL